MKKTIDTNFYKQKKQTLFYGAIAFLIIVGVGTLALFFYVQSIESSNEALSTNIDQVDRSIQEISADKRVQIYNLYERNEVLFEELTYGSRISSFVNHLKQNFNKYDIEGRGFNYDNGVVTVNIQSNTDDDGYAYGKAGNFIGGYKTDDKAFFTLDTINTFDGYDELEFTGTFTLIK